MNHIYYPQTAIATGLRDVINKLSNSREIRDARVSRTKRLLLSRVNNLSFVSHNNVKNKMNRRSHDFGRDPFVT